MLKTLEIIFSKTDHNQCQFDLNFRQVEFQFDFIFIKLI